MTPCLKFELPTFLFLQKSVNSELNLKHYEKYKIHCFFFTRFNFLKPYESGKQTSEATKKKN